MNEGSAFENDGFLADFYAMEPPYQFPTWEFNDDIDYNLSHEPREEFSLTDTTTIPHDSTETAPTANVLQLLQLAQPNTATFTPFFVHTEWKEGFRTSTKSIVCYYV